jgi:hypothetical protein
MKIKSLALATSLVMLSITSAIAQSDHQAPEEPEGMQSLFNGKDLSGWDGDPRLWSVQDGAIRGETTEENKAKGNTFLINQDINTADFELRLSFRCNEVNNSGIQYRSEHIADGTASNEWVVRGYQYEIRNEQDFPNVSGFIYGEKLGRGRICLVGEKAVIEDGEKKVLETLITEEEFQELFNLDDWNEVIIHAESNHIRHYMNGRLILDFVDDPELTLRDGVLALQLHAGAPMWVPRSSSGCTTHLKLPLHVGIENQMLAHQAVAAKAEKGLVWYSQRSSLGALDREAPLRRNRTSPTTLPAA